jgi:hypothetical protein
VFVKKILARVIYGTLVLQDMFCSQRLSAAENKVFNVVSIDGGSY